MASITFKFKYGATEKVEVIYPQYVSQLTTQGSNKGVQIAMSNRYLIDLPSDYISIELLRDGINHALEHNVDLEYRSNEFVVIKK